MVGKNMERVIACFIVRTSKKNDSDLAWVLEFLTEFELIVDSYDQPLERYTDYEEQKNNYSASWGGDNQPETQRW
jgi:hypothetical protein